MIAPFLILTGWTLIVAAAAFTWGRLTNSPATHSAATSPSPENGCEKSPAPFHMSVTDLLMQGERLHEEAQEVLRSNVVQFPRSAA